MADPVQDQICGAGAAGHQIRPAQADRPDQLADEWGQAVGHGQGGHRGLALVHAARHSGHGRARHLRREAAIVRQQSVVARARCQAAIMRQQSMVARARRTADRERRAVAVELVTGAGKGLNGAGGRCWAVLGLQRRDAENARELADREFEVRDGAVQTLYGVGLTLQARLPLAQQPEVREALERAVRNIDAVVASLRGQLGELGQLALTMNTNRQVVAAAQREAAARLDKLEPRSPSEAARE